MSHVDKLAAQDQFVNCFINDQLTRRTPISSILLIAEYTTNEGRMLTTILSRVLELMRSLALRRCALSVKITKDRA